MNIDLSAQQMDQLSRVAKKLGRSPERLVIEILERELPHQELMADFVREALESDAEVEAGGPTYSAEDVHAWMERLARGGKPPKPNPRKH
jgi:hypothetical protein